MKAFNTAEPNGKRQGGSMVPRSNSLTSASIANSSFSIQKSRKSAKRSSFPDGGNLGRILNGHGGNNQMYDDETVVEENEDRSEQSYTTGTQVKSHLHHTFDPNEISYSDATATAINNSEKNLRINSMSFNRGLFFPKSARQLALSFSLLSRLANCP